MGMLNNRNRKMPLLRSIHLVATIFTLTIIFASSTTLVSASTTGNTTTTTTSVGGEEQETVSSTTTTNNVSNAVLGNLFSFGEGIEASVNPINETYSVISYLGNRLIMPPNAPGVVINATETGNLTLNIQPNGLYIEQGQGFIVTEDGAAAEEEEENATLTFVSLGTTNPNGTGSRTGVAFYNTNSTGQLAFFDNMVGIFQTEFSPEGSRFGEWEWRGGTLPFDNGGSTPPANTTSNMAGFNHTETEAEVILGKNPIANILANELETRINKSGAILEITSRLPEVKSAPNASSISPELHGIPRDVDIPKRQVAQDILDTDKDFEVIYFLMPNGGMYLVEPYFRQENLTRNNFAFRDYYRVALDTGDTYLSDILISASTGRPQANIVVPIYSENNRTLVGLWGAGLNITMLSNSLQSLDLTSNNERVVYIDQQGQKIADSDSQSSSSSLISNNNTSSNESFADLQSFRNAINGQSGTITEIINGTMTAVSYHPVKAFSNVWVVLFMQPYDNDNDDMVSDKTIIMQNDLVTQDEQEEVVFMVQDID
jgi:hypothetical protein